MVPSTRTLLKSCLVKIFVLVSVWCVVEGRSCSEFDNCTLCISSSLGCKWCSDVNFNGSKCLESSDYSKSCKSGFEDPPSTSSIVEDAPFSDSIQVYPQALSVNLRPGKTATFNVSIKPAPTFPLDVYFLMDFTESMKDDLAAIRRIAYRLGTEIRKISSNFRIGLGSFSDKTVTPMEPPTIYQRRNPCLNSGGNCPPNYSFRNLYSLGDSRTNFYLKIRDATTSGNFDPPEGGMDALLQTVVCTDVIGWRPEPARRLLVYISDGPFHYGYDGKIAGVVTPHDGKCHMRKSANGPYDEYTEAERLDYPSISMVAAKLQQFNIHPVFGVPVANARESQQGNPVYDLYKNLSNYIPNAVVQPLSPNSENLVEAVRSAYYKIANNVQLSLANGKLDDIDVKFEAFCNGTELTNGTTCPDVLIGQEVSFRVSVTAKRCTPELLSGNAKLTISTGFFGSVTVNLSAVCDCDCVNKQVEGAEECSGLGTLTCGKCHCDSGIYGKVCECGTSVNGTVPTCKTGSNGMLCSGPNAGECYCGECMCNKDVGGVKGHMYYGEACECNNFECQLGTNNKMCSGHGTCGCGGECECDTTSTGNRYTGDVCECYPDDDTCRSSPLEVPCGGHGTCKCGLCECEPGYAGEFCDICVNKICRKRTCRPFDDCISCIFTIEEETIVQHDYEECQSLCNNMTIRMSNQASRINSGNDTLECKSTISSETCSGLNFVVRTTNNVIYVSSTPSNCVPRVQYIAPWWIVVPMVVGLIVSAILIIVFAKLFIVYLDYREYRNWLADLKGVKFSETENPVFLSAWEKFYCPMYPGNFEKGLIGSISTVKANSDTDSDGGSYKDSPQPRKHNMRNPIARIKHDSKFGQSRSVPTLLEDEEIDANGGNEAIANGSTVSVHQDQTKQVRSQDLLNRDDDETLQQLIMSLTKSNDSHKELVESV